MHRISEKETRKELIDPALERAGRVVANSGVLMYYIYIVRLTLPEG